MSTPTSEVATLAATVILETRRILKKITVGGDLTRDEQMFIDWVSGMEKQKRRDQIREIINDR